MSRYIILLLVLFILVASATITQSQGFGISLIPVVPSQNITFVQIHQNLVKLSKARAHRFMRVSPADKNTPSIIESPIKKSFSGYLYVEIYIGNPPVKTNLALDTGGDVTWVQCAECTKCFPVSMPNFDRRRSSTYQPMSNDDPLCSGLSTHDHPAAGNGPCSYLVESLNGQISEGEIGFDALTLSSEFTQPQQIPHVAFGCGLENDVDAGPEGPFGNQIAGVFGLVKGSPSSLLQQSVTLQRFSYCLPLDLELGNQTVLYFGNGTELSGPDVQVTPFLDDYYSLKLNAISMNGEPLPIDPASFLPPASGGLYIDSVSANSFLVADVYNILQQGLIDYFDEHYGWLPLNSSARLDPFELCYSLPSSEGGGYISPTLTFHFEGNANLQLDEESIFKVFDEANQFCMTILPLGIKEGPSILGTLQQANYRFLFDAAASKLSFAKDIC